MQIRFDGKIVVVSGAGHGFGRAIAATFAGLGARVFGCDLSAAELTETAKAGVTTQVLDLTDRAAATEWVRGIETATGGALDVLVTNAGGVAGQEGRRVEDVPDADWDRIFAINVGAAFALSRAAALAMKRAGAGRIVNISSGAATQASLTGIQVLRGQARGRRADPATGARARPVRHHGQQRRAGLRPHQRGDREAMGELWLGRAAGAGRSDRDEAAGQCAEHRRRGGVLRLRPRRLRQRASPVGRPRPGIWSNLCADAGRETRHG